MEPEAPSCAKSLPVAGKPRVPSPKPVQQVLFHPRAVYLFPQNSFHATQEDRVRAGRTG